MSVSLSIHSIYDEDIQALLIEPLRLEILYFGNLDPERLEELDDKRKQRLLNWKPKSPGEKFDVKAMFQSLHYMLTGFVNTNEGEFPLNFLNGRRLTIGEIGWGPVSFYTETDVKYISKTLNELNFDFILSRFNADFFNQNQIYPSRYQWRDTDGLELLEAIKNLVSFVNKIADENKGIYLIFL